MGSSQHCMPTSLHRAEVSLPLGAQQRRDHTTNSECFHGCRKQSDCEFCMSEMLYSHHVLL